MAENQDVRRLVDAFEAAIEAQYPHFENCEPKVFEVRLDVTLKASLALLSAVFAAVLKYYGVNRAPAMFAMAYQNLVRLTQTNLQEGPVMNKPVTPEPDRKLH